MCKKNSPNLTYAVLGPKIENKSGKRVGTLTLSQENGFSWLGKKKIKQMLGMVSKGTKNTMTAYEFRMDPHPECAAGF